MAPKKPKKAVAAKPALIDLALRPVAVEFGQNSKGLGKKLAKAAGTTADIVNGLLTMTRRAPSTVTSGGRAFGRKFKQLFSKKLETVPIDRRIRPLDAIAVPTLQSLVLRIDEPDIADMFANLLCASIDKETAGHVHPAFVRILSEMVSDEAKILRHLKIAGAEPVIDVLSMDPGTESVGARLEGLSLMSIRAGANNLAALPVHTSNLIRLGLAIVPVDEVFEDAAYLELEKSDPICALVEHVLSNGRIPKLVRKGIRLTEFGRAFLRVCLPDEK
jgi:hypothetical protein